MQKSSLTPFLSPDTFSSPSFLLLFLLTHEITAITKLAITTMFPIDITIEPSNVGPTMYISPVSGSLSRRLKTTGPRTDKQMPTKQNAPLCLSEKRKTDSSTIGGVRVIITTAIIEKAKPIITIMPPRRLTPSFFTSPVSRSLYRARKSARATTARHTPKKKETYTLPVRQKKK